MFNLFLSVCERVVEMCNKYLKPIIEKFKKQDMAVFETIYGEFEKLLKFYSNKLCYDDAAGDLTLFFIELLYRIDLTKFYLDDSVSIRKYIAVSIRNQYIALSQQWERYCKFSNKLYDNLDGYLPDFEDRFSLLESMDILSQKQKMIIIYKYLYGYNNFEIAVLLGVSYQAVNQLKNRALANLKDFLLGDEISEKL